MIVLYDKAEHLVNQAPDNKTIFNIATQTPSNTTRIVTAPRYKTNRRHKKYVYTTTRQAVLQPAT